MKRPPITYREFQAVWAREQAYFDWALVVFCVVAAVGGMFLGRWP